jgi:serine/threonine-protein kinase
MLGETLGGYRLTQEVGSGGTGTVYLAEHERLSRRAVVKVLLPAYASDPSLLEQYFADARAAAMTAHPGFLELLDTETDADGRSFLVTEYLEGQTLASAMSLAGRKRRGSLRRLNIVARATSALAAAHAAGVVHGDLKPENLLLADGEGEEPIVKLLDVGLSWLWPNRLPLLPIYASPEQCRGEALSPASDIYALGCIAFEITCGQPPFPLSDPAALAQAHQSQVPPRPSSLVPALPPAFDDLMARMLDKDPGSRPDLHELEQQLSELSEESAARGGTAALNRPAAPTPGGGTPSAPAATQLYEGIKQGKQRRGAASPLPAPLPRAQALRTSTPASSPRDTPPPASKPAGEPAPRQAQHPSTLSFSALPAPSPAVQPAPAPTAKQAPLAPASAARQPAPSSEKPSSEATPDPAQRGTWKRATTPKKAVPDDPASANSASEPQPLRERRRPAPRTGAPRPAEPPAKPRGIGTLVAGLLILALGGLAAGGFWLSRHPAVLADAIPSVKRATATAPALADARPAQAATELLSLSGGTFRMGSSGAELDAAVQLCKASGSVCRRATFEREGPVREVTVDPFALERTEVTNAQLADWLSRQPVHVEGQRFVRDGSGALLLDLHSLHGGIEQAGSTFRARAGMAQRPAVQVTWFGAQRYCRELGRRLPTEAEWELAARGSSGRRFPWGAGEPRCGDVTFGWTAGAGCPTPSGPGDVGTSPGDVTPEGLRDLGGNVAEWVADAYVAPYRPCGAECRNPVAGAPGAGAVERVVRGGDWQAPAVASRGASRAHSEQGAAQVNVGFRCAGSLATGSPTAPRDPGR